MATPLHKRRFRDNEIQNENSDCRGSTMTATNHDDQRHNLGEICPKNVCQIRLNVAYSEE